MKNIILLILLIPVNLYSQEKLSISGTYQIGKDIDKENVGEILVVEKPDNQAMIYITTSLKAPSYNTFTLLTKIGLIDNKGYYQTKEDKGTLGFVFTKNSVQIIDSNGIASQHLPINGVKFKKVDNESPEYYINGAGERLEFNETAFNYEINYYTGKKLWDFIGIWNFSQNKESLNISKNISNEEIKIQFNSWTDGYEDRFFENCKFIDGKIIGDYYGGKKNVILELEDDKLLLTIDPFHEFTPTKKQVFKKSEEFIFKYNVSNSNSYLLNKPNINAPKIDSIPLGDRILVINENFNKSFFKNKFYVPRFHKNLIENKNLYLSDNNLRNTKPLFLESMQIKGLTKFNTSELFVQRLYTSEKLKSNIVIVPLSGNEQNHQGQQKLLVDEVAYIQLGLNVIGKKYNENNLKIYITGTVDLSKEFYSLVIDYQYNDEFYTYLLNYNLNGKYLDHLLIGRDDYVESMNPLVSNFAPGEIYTKKSIQILDEEQSDIGSGYYQTYEQERFTINQAGQFIVSNYSKSFINESQLSYKLLTQKLKSKNYGNASLSLFLNYIDTNQASGYVISMHTQIETENGTDLTIPMNISDVAGFYYPPYGDFIGPNGELQKLFCTNYHEGLMKGLNVSFYLKDRNSDGLEDLNMIIEDTNYREWPREELLFIQKENEWVLTLN